MRFKLRMFVYWLTVIILLVSCNGCRVVGSAYNSLSSRISKREGPIKGFGRELDSLVDVDSEVDTAELLYQRYINSLRDFYSEKMKSYNDKNPALINRRCKLIVGKCKADMEDAIPKKFLNIWKYNDTLIELEEDINHYAESLESNPVESIDKYAKLKSTLKWLAGQLLLFSVNLFQLELRRYLEMRSTEKRLAEIPEFPVL